MLCFNRCANPQLGGYAWQLMVLAEELMTVTCDACRYIENVINRLAKSQGPSLKDLGFLEKSSSAQGDAQGLVTQAVHIN